MDRLGGSDLSSALRSRHDPGKSGVEMSFNLPHSKHRVHGSRLPVRCSQTNHVSIVREKLTVEHREPLSQLRTELDLMGHTQKMGSGRVPV